MACDLLMSSQAGANNPAFSPLTLFECTITNAQMLIDSMADRELLQALKIAGGLHTHIVGVIEPRYDRVCQRSDEHEACCQAAAAGATPSKSTAAGPTAQPIVGENGDGNLDSKSSAAAAPAMKSETAAVGVKSELLDADAFAEDDEEDCLILEEDCSFAAAHSGIPMSPSASSSASRKRGRPMSPSALMGGLAGASSSSALAASAAAAGFPGSSQQLAECKNVLRTAYKNIKGNGPHLFDFSLSFHDPVNQRVSEQIISLARQQMSHLRLPNDTWWKHCFPSVYSELTKYDKHRERMKHRMRSRRLMNSKLSRRQKSFELLATSLSTDKFDKYRIILSRDYTSSDEEAESGSAGASGDDSTGGGGGGGALRVRELPWESAELREMKQQLDSIYLENCATQKQAQQLRGTVRDSGCVSGRTPPANCPSWALAEEYR